MSQALAENSPHTQSGVGSTPGTVIPQKNQFQLSFRFPDRSVKRFPVTKPIVTLGRNEDNDIVLPFEYISAYHAQLQRQFDGSFELVDMGSYNSSAKNGNKVSRVIVKAGDVVVFGILGAVVEPL